MEFMPWRIEKSDDRHECVIKDPAANRGGGPDSLYSIKPSSPELTIGDVKQTGPHHFVFTEINTATSDVANSRAVSLEHGLATFYEPKVDVKC